MNLKAATERIRELLSQVFTQELSKEGLESLVDRILSEFNEVSTYSFQELKKIYEDNKSIYAACNAEAMEIAHEAAKIASTLVLLGNGKYLLSGSSSLQSPIGLSLMVECVRRASCVETDLEIMRIYWVLCMLTYQMMRGDTPVAPQG